MYSKQLFSTVVIFACIVSIVYNIGSIVFDPKFHYFDRYYTEDYFNHVQYLFDHSQYRQKNPTSIIADEVVFRYAAGAYIRGTDPILVNSEHTPLGKYILGLSYTWFQTDAEAIIFFGILSLLVLWFLSKQVLKTNAWSLLPVALFSSEKLFLNQLRITPLLDIIQLPFILFAIAAFLSEEERGKFFWTALALGFVAATKTVIPAILLVICFFLFFVWQKKSGKIINFVLWLPIGLAVLFLSYIKTFLDGYTIVDFLKFQKWIFLYQQSKLIFPLSFWRLALFNQWQAWWGDMHILKTDDWRLTWPILILTPLFTLLLYKHNFVEFKKPIQVLLIWSLLYEAFLSLGITATRFFLPLLPILYILLFFLLHKFLKRSKISL